MSFCPRFIERRFEIMRGGRFTRPRRTRDKYYGRGGGVFDNRLFDFVYFTKIFRVGSGKIGAGFIFFVEFVYIDYFHLSKLPVATRFTPSAIFSTITSPIFIGSVHVARFILFIISKISDFFIGLSVLTHTIAPFVALTDEVSTRTGQTTLLSRSAERVFPFRPERLRVF